MTQRSAYGWWRRFSAALPGAGPLPPFPLNAISRLVILVLYLGYGVSGHLEPNVFGTPLGVAFVVVSMAGIEIAFALARHDRERLLRTWAWVLPLDVLMLNVGAATDRTAFSLLSVVSLATIYSASAMFPPRYVLALAGMSAVAMFTANTMVDAVDGGEPSFWAAAFAAILFAGVGGFAANRSRSEEVLRQEMIASREREEEHRRSLQAALESARQSEMRFLAFSENAPAALLLLNAEGKLVYSSPRTTRIFGTSNEAEGWQNVLLPGEFQRMQAAVATALSGSVARAELRIRQADGSERQLGSIWFPIDRGAGAIVTDVTQQRALAAQVVRSQQMETVGTLAGGIAHDFNNLLAAILGNIDMARAELPDDGIAGSCLADAQVAVERGAQLVRQLLDYARPGVTTREQVELAALIDETLKLTRRGLSGGITVGLDLPPAGAVVEGNFSALQQVLINLIVNARDAMPNGGELKIAYQRQAVGASYAGEGPAPGDYHTIVVSDTGTGIADEALGRIFDPFFTTKEVGKGTGLGLSSALGILRAHGGWMDVETSVDEGSAFRVLLPVPQPAEAEEAA